jgi:hypothetical protein
MTGKPGPRGVAPGWFVVAPSGQIVVVVREESRGFAPYFGGVAMGVKRQSGRKTAQVVGIEDEEAHSASGSSSS